MSDNLSTEMFTIFVCPYKFYLQSLYTTLNVSDNVWRPRRFMRKISFEVVLCTAAVLFILLLLLLLSLKHYENYLNQTNKLVDMNSVTSYLQFTQLTYIKSEYIPRYIYEALSHPIFTAESN